MNEPVHSLTTRAPTPAPTPTPAESAKPSKPSKPAKSSKPAKARSAAAPRTNDPARTMANIIEVATHEFSEKGLAGARVDVIAEATQTSKRMIYYYFGSKEGLYIAVLEDAYSRIRKIESELHLEDLEPCAALARLVAFTVDYQRANPDFIRLVMNENIHRGEFLARSQTIQARNVPVITGLNAVYQRGVAAGVFRAGLDPVDLHMSISALSFFNVANSHTFGLVFKLDLDEPLAVAQRRDNVVEMVLRYVSV